MQCLNPMPFHISMCSYLSVFTCEDLHVFQSDPSRFQQPLDKFFHELIFEKNTVFIWEVIVNSVIVKSECDKQFLKFNPQKNYYTSLKFMVHYFFAKYMSNGSQ